jgi:hypothetical protein
MKLAEYMLKMGFQIAMKPNNNNKSLTKIKLSKTFFRIAAGEVSASEVAAKKKADREAARQEASLKGKRFDRTDPFISNFER